MSAAVGPGTPCAWCGNPIPDQSATGRRTRPEAETCSKQCRQAKWRHNNGVFGKPAARKASAAPGGVPSRSARAARRDASRLEGRPIRVAYADPPYPGFAHLYADHPDFAGEVDHAELIRRLSIDFPDGWALSTSSKTLQMVLALCPPDVRIGAWTKPAMPTAAWYPYAAWEPVIFRGGRPVKRYDRVDWVQDGDRLEGSSTHGRGARSLGLIGAKPAGFCRWVFDSLGLQPGDELADLYPGSGNVARCFETFSAQDVTTAA